MRRQTRPYIEDRQISDLPPVAKAIRCEGSMDRAIELTVDVRSLPSGRREEAILCPLSAMKPGQTLLVVSDRDFHALEADLELDYPGKFLVRVLPEEGSRRHLAAIAKLGDTPRFRARWESPADLGWKTVRDP